MSTGAGSAAGAASSLIDGSKTANRVHRPSWPPPPPGAAQSLQRVEGIARGTDGPVEVECRTDECEVRQSLRVIAGECTCRPNLLGVEPEVIGVGVHLLEHEFRFFDTTGAREALDIPERAHREGALVAVDTVGTGSAVVPVDESVADELTPDLFERRQPAWIRRCDEVVQRHEQQRRVER